MSNLFIKMSVVAALVFAGGARAADNPLTADQAQRLLSQKVEHDKLYSTWISTKCIHFNAGEENKQFVEFNLHENHAGKCAGKGDPTTSPPIDTFRVNKLTKTVEWFVMPEGEYRPYQDAVASRKKS